MNNNRNSKGFQEETAFDDENRINWERKQKRKRLETDEEVADSDDIVTDAVDPKISKKRDSSRKKRRQLIYDEGIGQVVVKRKRKRQHDFVPDDDEWEDYN